MVFSLQCFESGTAGVGEFDISSFSNRCAEAHPHKAGGFVLPRGRLTSCEAKISAALR